MKVRWTERAAIALEEIQEYIERDAPAAAYALVEELIQKGDSLAAHPHKGRVVPEVRNPEIRELLHKGYRLIYRVSQRSIDILTVFEGHKQLEI